MKLKDAFGAAIISVVVSVWVYSKLYEEPLSVLWELTMLAIVIAAAYSVFGRRTMSSAIDEAKDLAGEKDD